MVSVYQVMGKQIEVSESQFLHSHSYSFNRLSKPFQGSKLITTVWNSDSLTFLFQLEWFLITADRIGWSSNINKFWFSRVNLCMHATVIDDIMCIGPVRCQIAFKQCDQPGGRLTYWPSTVHWKCWIDLKNNQCNSSVNKIAHNFHFMMCW